MTIYPRLADEPFPKPSGMVAGMLLASLKVSARQLGTHASDHTVASSPFILAASLDHLVSKREQCWRDLNTERLCCLKIDAKIELGWLLHRNVTDTFSL